MSGAFVELVRDGTTVAGVITDRLGSFRVTPVAAGGYRLRVSGLGYADQERELVLEAGATLDIEVSLERRAIQLPGLSVETTASRERARFEELAGTTVRELDVAEMRSVPGVAEADPIRAVEVLPGVVSTSDFSAAFNVRGGSQDENLILLDGVPVFSPFHLGGLFSVFNVDMLDRVELQSGGFPAEHGGRVSSVLEIESDPGDGTFGVDAGVSLLATRAAVKGRVPPGTSHALGLSSLRYRASARRSYFDVIMKPLFEFPYHLTDFQTFVEGWTKSGDRISLTAYTGKDVLDFSQASDESFPLRIDWDWGNDLVGVRWTRPHDGGGSLDVRANYSRYGTGLAFPDFNDTRFSSRIDQGQVRVDLDTRLAPGSSMQVGASAERLSYSNQFVTGGTDFSSGAGTGLLLGSYVQGRWSRPQAWLVEAGLRVDAWNPDPGSSVVDVAPRLAAKRFLRGGDVALKVAAGRYTQFLHSVRDEELPLGLDVWVLAGSRAPHVRSNQLQIGVEGYRDIDWFWSVEGYVRSFDGVVTLNATDDPNDPLDDLLAGDGTSYGLDFLVRKETGSVTGWAALSLLKAERTFPDPLSSAVIRPEVTYAPIFDRRVDFDLVLRYPAPWGWEGGLRWNLGTGTPFTRSVGSYAFYSPRFVTGGGMEWGGAQGDSGSRGGYGVVLGARNGARLPVYHRLDLSFRKRFEKSWGVLTPYVNVINAYNQLNPLFYFFEYESKPPVRSGVSMFPLLPTVGLEVTF